MVRIWGSVLEIRVLGNGNIRIGMVRIWEIGFLRIGMVRIWGCVLVLKWLVSIGIKIWEYENMRI